MKTPTPEECRLAWAASILLHLLTWPWILALVEHKLIQERGWWAFPTIITSLTLAALSVYLTTVALSIWFSRLNSK